MEGYARINCQFQQGSIVTEASRKKCPGRYSESRCSVFCGLSGWTEFAIRKRFESNSKVRGRRLRIVPFKFVVTVSRKIPHRVCFGSQPLSDLYSAMPIVVRVRRTLNRSRAHFASTMLVQGKSQHRRKAANKYAKSQIYL